MKPLVGMYVLHVNNEYESIIKANLIVSDYTFEGDIIVTNDPDLGTLKQARLINSNIKQIFFERDLEKLKEKQPKYFI